MFHLFQIYIANILSRCFRSRSGVAGRHPPTAAEVPPWFVCGCLRPTDASTTRIRRWGQVGVGSRFRHAGTGWALAMVLACGRGMGAGAASGHGHWMGCGREGMGCDAGVGAGATSEHHVRPDVRR